MSFYQMTDEFVQKYCMMTASSTSVFTNAAETSRKKRVCKTGFMHDEHVRTTENNISGNQPL